MYSIMVAGYIFLRWSIVAECEQYVVTINRSKSKSNSVITTIIDNSKNSNNNNKIVVIRILVL